MRMRHGILVCSCAIVLAGMVVVSASSFDMELERSAIYTPATARVVVSPDGRPRMWGGLQFRVSMFVAGVQVGEKMLTVQGDGPSIFELALPAQRGRVDGRCRVELFMEGQFVEAREMAMSLWPPFSTFPDAFTAEAVWVYDPSGRLQEILRRLNLKIVDAGLSAVLPSSEPAAVLFGEGVDGDSITRVRRSLDGLESRPVVVFLRQAEFPRAGGMEVVPGGDCRKVQGRLSSVLAEGLGWRDLMPLLKDVTGVRVVADENEFVLAERILSMDEQDDWLSCLATVERGGWRQVYCQLPIVDDFGANPVCGVLLRNLVAYACAEGVEDVPVIYDPVFEAAAPEPSQLAGISEGVSQLTDDRIWFVYVSHNEPGRPDGLRGRVYCHPDFSSRRLRKGTYFCFGEDVDVAGQVPDGPAVGCEYCQVSRPDREFAFELERPSYDLGLPFNRGEDVSDEEVVEAVDFIRSMARGAGYGGYKPGAPVIRIDKKDDLLTVKTGVQKRSDEGAGHIVTIHKNGGRYELVTVAPSDYGH